LRGFLKTDRQVDAQERPTRGQISYEATRIYDLVWDKSFSVGMNLFAGIDAVFWWILDIRIIFVGLSGYDSITFRRFLERNTGFNG
jgi:hypothetical protein